MNPPEVGVCVVLPVHNEEDHVLVEIDRIVAALDDVDQDALAEAFPDGVSGKTVENTLYLTEKSLFMLTDFLKNCGIDFEDGKSVRAAIDETPNAEVGIVIKHEPSDDGQRIFAKVGRTVQLGE